MNIPYDEKSSCRNRYSVSLTVKKEREKEYLCDVQMYKMRYNTYMKWQIKYTQ